MQVEGEARKLVSLTTTNLCRVYPHIWGDRLKSSNPDPTPFWCRGAQMVALNWQVISVSDFAVLTHVLSRPRTSGPS